MDTNGKPHGPAIEIDESGRKRLLGQYVHGERDGAWQYRDSRVGTTTTVHYRHGKYDGALVMRDSEGQLLLERGFRDGVLHGTSKLWTGHRLLQIQHHDRGKPSGVWEWFATDGTVERRYVYGDDNVLREVDGRALAPPPQQLELSDGTILARGECVRRAEQTEWVEGKTGGCLDLFERYQLCADEACRRRTIEDAATRRSGPH